MNHVLINPRAVSKQAAERWERLSETFSDHRITSIEQQSQLIPDLKNGDKIICAGGNGTVHHFINQFIECRGLDNLQHILLGVVGPGHHKGVLQPEKESQQMGSFYQRYGNESQLQDLVEISIRQGRSTLKRYMVSSCSLGFLAAANDHYNRDQATQKLKKMNPKLAEFYTLLRTLSAFKPIEVALFSDFINFDGTLSNINIMKSACYTKNLFYPREIPSDSGHFQGLLLKHSHRANLFNRFLQAFLFGRMTSTFDTAWRGSHLKVVSGVTIPIEIDGEIYWGDGFEFQCLQGKLRVCV